MLRADFGPMPAVLGHEAAGIIEACGPATRGYTVGDTVVLSEISELWWAGAFRAHAGSTASGRDPRVLLTGAMADGDIA